ncbi:protein SODIUM POTASSIUM ROOT DEFECTIVE 1-like [Corylus avellana]|uniref:protein SODIUM POTASSIUM ROOT DEFECTIVE 1-like n=1 Tax=Corylus avellana TaxID=13451 RepID=UPI00286A1923|nr:protein SODIUM POTASSIUM ROOT DEFECTIVE 1-like [Corylus avellana]
MSMRSRTSKKMRGFMCQSPAATAVCMATDSGSVVVPRRSSNQRAQIDHRRLNMINNGKYTRLAVDDKRADFAPCMKREQDPEHLPKPPLQKPSSIASSDTVFQVVVMRVSIHCQGCAGKLKKHLSKMEGVTSFSIDVEAKRVTVMGHVSPVGVLESVSKVKKAEFWPC